MHAGLRTYSEPVPDSRRRDEQENHRRAGTTGGFLEQRFPVQNGAGERAVSTQVHGQGRSHRTAETVSRGPKALLGGVPGHTDEANAGARATFFGHLTNSRTT